MSLIAGGERIKQSDSELLLGATIHHSGRWAAMIRDGKTSLQCQLRNRVNAQKKKCPRRLQDEEDGGWWHCNVKTSIPPPSVWGSTRLSSLESSSSSDGSSKSCGWLQVLQVEQHKNAELSRLVDVKQQYVASTLILTHNWKILKISTEERKKENNSVHIELTVSLQKAFGSKGKQPSTHTALETQSHVR